MGNNKLFLCRPSYLTPYVFSTRHYELKVCQFSSGAPCDYRQQLISVAVKFSTSKPKLTTAFILKLWSTFGYSSKYLNRERGGGGDIKEHVEIPGVNSKRSGSN